MKSKLLIAGLLVAFGSTQSFAKDTLQSLHNESKVLSEQEKVLYEKIADPNSKNAQDLRCVELPKLAEKRISINDRTKKLAPTKYSKEIDENNKTIKSKLVEAKKQFGC
jgi:hypothetical protein